MIIYMMIQVWYHQFTNYASILVSYISYFLPHATFQLFIYIYMKDPYIGL